MKIGDIVRIPEAGADWNGSMAAKSGMEGIVVQLDGGKAKVRFAGTGKMTRRIINYGIRRDEFIVFPADCLEIIGHADAWACPVPRGRL